MTDTILVANASRSDLFLPCGTGIPARGSAPVPVASLQLYRDHPVVKHWLESRTLTPAEPIPDPKPAVSATPAAAAPVAKPKAKDA